MDGTCALKRMACVVALNLLAPLAFSEPPGDSDLVADLSPQLGAQLDVNGFSLGDGTLELLSFIETASAVNQCTITNAATGNAPRISGTGDDANVGLVLDAKGNETVCLGGNNELDIVCASNDATDSLAEVASDSTQTSVVFRVLGPTGNPVLEVDPIINDGALFIREDGATTDDFFKIYFSSGNSTIESRNGSMILIKTTNEHRVQAAEHSFYDGSAAKWKIDSGTYNLRTHEAGAADGPGLLYLAPSGTVPNIVPDVDADLDTGIGSAADDQLSLIAGSAELVRLVEDTIDYVDVMGCRFYGSSATPPVTCDGTVDCAEYYDTDLNLTCTCNATNWLQNNDWSTVCT